MNARVIFHAHNINIYFQNVYFIQLFDKQIFRKKINEKIPFIAYFNFIMHFAHKKDS